MNAHLMRTDFAENAETIVSGSNEAGRIKEFNLLNDPVLAGRYNARHEGAVRTHEQQQQKEKDSLMFARSINAIQAQNMSMERMLDTLNVSVSQTLSWLRNDKTEAEKEHLEAAKKVAVDPKEVFKDPLTGEPATLARKQQIDDANRRCSIGLTKEDLVLDEKGRPVMDVGKTTYLNKHMQKRMEEALDTAQENDKFIEKVEKGEMTFKDLPEDKQIDLLKNVSHTLKQELYKEAGFSQEQITEMDAKTQPEPKGLLAHLANPDTASSPAFLQISPQNQMKLTPGL